MLHPVPKGGDALGFISLMMPNFVAKALGVTNGSKVRAFAGMDRADGPPMALLARQTAGGLEYAGGAMLTLSGENREYFGEAVEWPPIAMSKRAGAMWMELEVRVRARYLKGSDKLRHATLLEVR
jgi:hypothetical protein